MNRSAPIFGKGNRREPANQLSETKYHNLTNQQLDDTLTIVLKLNIAEFL
jgi:hypothetical protein